MTRESRRIPHAPRVPIVDLSAAAADLAILTALRPGWRARIDLPHGPAGCWLWTGATTERDRGGYGHVRIGRGAWTRAHRAVWETLRGPLPPGVEGDHLCRQTLCVSPHHIDPTDHATNVLRALSVPAGVAERA